MYQFTLILLDWEYTEMVFNQSKSDFCGQAQLLKKPDLWNICNSCLLYVEEDSDGIIF